MGSVPRASRPTLPGYGVLPENEGQGLLPWSWAEERLEESHNYWIATARPDGRPHLMPVWGVWHGACLWFSTGPESVKARNLDANPRCSASTERGDEAVVVEGTVDRVDSHDRLAGVLRAYKAKYDWSMEGEAFYCLHPHVAFGFIEHADQFSSTATRWAFE